MGHLKLLVLLICSAALSQAIAQFCPPRDSIVHVGLLVVQPTRLPPSLEKYQGISFLPIAFGTGFIVSEDGHVVTTLHVIRRAEKLGTEIPVAGKKLVICANRPTELYDCDDVRIIAIDQDHELALLKMKSVPPTASLSVVRLGPTKPMEGDQIWAAGYPREKRGQLAVTTGTFFGAGPSDAALATSSSPMPGERFWFAEMTVENGTSGGPVYLQDGSVVGLVVNRSTTRAIAGFVPAQYVIGLMARSGIQNGKPVE